METGFVLVINAGSSSLKFSVFEQSPTGRLDLQFRGHAETIPSRPLLVVRNEQGQILEEVALTSSETGKKYATYSEVLTWLSQQLPGQKLAAIGHRVVHGGEEFSEPVRLTPEILQKLRDLIPLAPLHQPYNLHAIGLASDHFPAVPQVACFDTAFHRGHPDVADLVALPEEITRKGLRRYGFHGLSYDYVATALGEMASRISGNRVIIAHLGSGSSLCALRDRQSVDCTLGFSALDGLCMGTRPGSLDPGVLLFLIQQLGHTPTQVEDILYRRSGLLGISGISHDMRALLASPNPRARLAVDYFVYRVVKEIGALTAVLAGVDALVFTAGIGENSPEIRQRICEGCAWLGLSLDLAANQAGKALISSPSSSIQVWIVPANEELAIAQHTVTLC